MFFYTQSILLQGVMYRAMLDAMLNPFQYWGI